MKFAQGTVLVIKNSMFHKNKIAAETHSTQVSEEPWETEENNYRVANQQSILKPFQFLWITFIPVFYL